MNSLCKLFGHCYVRSDEKIFEKLLFMWNWKTDSKRESIFNTPGKFSDEMEIIPFNKIMSAATDGVLAVSFAMPIMKNYDVYQKILVCFHFTNCLTLWWSALKTKIQRQLITSKNNIAYSTELFDANLQLHDHDLIKAKIWLLLS